MLVAAEERGKLGSLLRSAVDHFAIDVQVGGLGLDSELEEHLLQLVFDAWRDTGAWPNARALQRQAEERDDQIEIDALARQLDRQVGWLEQRTDPRIVLRVRGLEMCKGADEFLGVFVRCIRLLYDRYRAAPSDRPVITDADLRSALTLSDELVSRMFDMLENEWFLFDGGSGAADGSWSRDVSPNIRHFRAVSTIQAYLEVVDNLARPFVATPVDSHVRGAERSTPIPAINHLHPEILRVASALFAGGHLGEAVFAAFKAVEVQVRKRTGLEEFGRELTQKAFGGQKPLIALATTAPTRQRDEQEGFRFIYMGAMQGIRNLGAHDFPALDERPAGAYLGFASLLLDRLDAAVGSEVPSEAHRPGGLRGGTATTD